MSASTDLKAIVASAVQSTVELQVASALAKHTAVLDVRVTKPEDRVTMIAVRAAGMHTKYYTVKVAEMT